VDEFQSFVSMGHKVCAS